MKILFSIFFVALSVSSSFAQSDSTYSGPLINVYVDGLSCPFCAYTLEKKLKDLPAIDKLDINIDDGHIKISLKDAQQISMDDIKEKVDDAGFTLHKIEVDGKEYKIKKNESDEK